MARKCTRNVKNRSRRPGNPLLCERVLPPHSPAQLGVSPSRPRRLGCTPRAASGRPCGVTRSMHRLQPRRLGCTPLRSVRVPLGTTRPSSQMKRVWLIFRLRKRCLTRSIYPIELLSTFPAAQLSQSACRQCCGCMDIGFSSLATKAVNNHIFILLQPRNMPNSGSTQSLWIGRSGIMPAK
jgi:hypothetical protein